MKEIFGYCVEDIRIGMRETFSKTITSADITLFAGVSGDTNPLHLDDDFASLTKPGKRIAHGMLSASLISTIIGTKLPGPGCLYISQALKFKAPVKAGDTVRATATVTEIDREKARVKLDTVCMVGSVEVITGEAETWVPCREQQNNAVKGNAT